MAGVELGMFLVLSRLFSAGRLDRQVDGLAQPVGVVSLLHATHAPDAPVLEHLLDDRQRHVLKGNITDTVRVLANGVVGKRGAPLFVERRVVGGHGRRGVDDDDEKCRKRHRYRRVGDARIVTHVMDGAALRGRGEKGREKWGVAFVDKLTLSSTQHFFLSRFTWSSQENIQARRLHARIFSCSVRRDDGRRRRGGGLLSPGTDTAFVWGGVAAGGVRRVE